MSLVSLPRSGWLIRRQYYIRSKIRAISPNNRLQSAARIPVTLFRHNSTPNLDNLIDLIGPFRFGVAQPGALFSLGGAARVQLFC